MLEPQETAARGQVMDHLAILTLPQHIEMVA